MSLFVDYVESQRIKRGWSVNELAGRIGLSLTGLSNILRKEAVPTVATVKRIALALQVDELYLLELMVRSDEPQTEIFPEVSFLAKRVSQLAPQERQELVGVFNAFLDLVSRLKSTQLVTYNSQNGSETLPIARAP